MLGDFAALLRAFLRASTVIDGLEGYPVFLPPRSMAQAEFVETLERLAGGWRVGVQPHPHARARSAHEYGNGHANGKLAIGTPPLPPMETHILMPRTFFDPLAPSTSSSDLSSGSSSSSALVIPGLGLEVEPETSPGFDLVESLNCARIILAPLVEWQRALAEQSALKKLSSRLFSSSCSLASVGGCGSGGGSSENTRKKPLLTTIPLHGPRVEIVLVWMATVWLAELESVSERSRGLLRG